MKQFYHANLRAHAKQITVNEETPTFEFPEVPVGWVDGADVVDEDGWFGALVTSVLTVLLVEGCGDGFDVVDDVVG